MIKAKIKQGRLTLASVQGEDEKAVKEISDKFDELMEKHDNIRIIIDWSAEEDNGPANLHNDYWN